MDNKDNILIYKEKPYYTDEEEKIYMKLMISEAEKQGNKQVANHYRLLLKMIENSEQNGMADFLLNHNKKK